jgi:hypothetical protein
LLHDLGHVGFGDPQVSRPPLTPAHETVQTLTREESTGGLFDQFIRRFTLCARDRFNRCHEIVG